MTLPIGSTCVSVEGLLTGPERLSVPYFQRGYAWQQEHAERLLSDLLQHAAGSGTVAWYPLGAVILAHRPPALTADVADGHQRLITLTILIAVLRDLEADPDRRRRLAGCIADSAGSLRFTTLASTSNILSSLVQANGATLLPAPDDADELSPSEVAVVDNRSLIARRVAALPAEERRRLADFLLDRTLLVRITVEEESAARLLFTTMHETGVKPQSTDLLKSRVLGRCDGDVRENAQSIWEGLEARLGRDRMDGLFRHVAAIKTRTLAREHLDVALGEAFDFESAGEASGFVLQHLRPIGARYVEMLNAGLDPTATPGPVFRRLQYLSWIMRHDTWRLPALHWLVCHDYHHIDTLTFLRRLEARAWTAMITAEEAVRRDRRYLLVLDEIDRGKALEPGSTLEVGQDERDAVRRILTGPNFARRPYKLFLLLRLNSIYEGPHAVTVTPEATTEHIFPQRPGATSAWSRDYAGDVSTNSLRHALGNLTLLTEHEQNRAANRDFDAKRQVYETSAFSLSRRLAQQGTWRPDDIRARTADLAQDFMSDLGLA